MTFPCHDFCHTEFRKAEFYCLNIIDSKISGLGLPFNSGGVFTFKL